MPRTSVTRERAFAKLYADLASLGQWTDARRDVLLNRFCRLTGDDPRRAGPFFDYMVQPRAREWIGALLDGCPVQPGRDAGEVTWVMVDGTVRDLYPRGAEILLGELVALIHARPFPFRRCRQCARVFVRAGAKLECSPGCRTAWRTQNDKTNAARQKQYRLRKQEEAEKRTKRPK